MPGALCSPPFAPTLPPPCPQPQLNMPEDEVAETIRSFRKTHLSELQALAQTRHEQSVGWRWLRGTWSCAGLQWAACCCSIQRFTSSPPPCPCCSGSSLGYGSQKAENKTIDEGDDGEGTAAGEAMTMPAAA